MTVLALLAYATSCAVNPLTRPGNRFARTCRHCQHDGAAVVTHEAPQPVHRPQDARRCRVPSEGSPAPPAERLHRDAADRTRARGRGGARVRPERDGGFTRRSWDGSRGGCTRRSWDGSSGWLCPRDRGFKAARGCSAGAGGRRGGSGAIHWQGRSGGGNGAHKG